jgi:hypothetical protein
MVGLDYHLPRELWALCLEWVLVDAEQESEIPKSYRAHNCMLQLALVCKAWEVRLTHSDL